ncbi:receptor-like protein kinase [Sorghum bicolor]|uniref:receptor-like protein kinase n=1 Tax=Sorghum bicolor TaxID=4558 RepID=UPI000B42615F|nr:receptor-like protein kinase [Sorghum bicolor]|eukprot:XP_021320627.1 receptor-like protein kinase [Sorghum bicolor]
MSSDIRELPLEVVVGQVEVLEPSAAVDRAPAWEATNGVQDMSATLVGQPASWSASPNLTSALHRFKLIGAFPSYLTKMQQLEELYLRDNSLTGAIPPGIWDLKNLQILQVQRNNLTGNVVIDGFAALRLNGSIPIDLAGCATLEVLELNNNQLSGQIPANFGYGTPQLQRLNLANNQLSGRIS